MWHVALRIAGGIGAWAWKIAAYRLDIPLGIIVFGALFIVFLWHRHGELNDELAAMKEKHKAEIEACAEAHHSSIDALEKVRLRLVQCVQEDRKVNEARAHVEQARHEWDLAREVTIRELRKEREQLMSRDECRVLRVTPICGPVTKQLLEGTRR